MRSVLIAPETSQTCKSFAASDIHDIGGRIAIESENALSCINENDMGTL